MAETILVIDDDPAMLEFLTQSLSPEGFAVSTVVSGQEGIHQAILRHPDLILLDLRMPVRDGVSVITVLRANPATKHIPIIVVTGVLSPAQLEEARVSGADDFVSKPVDLIDLLIRVRALLECRAIEDPVKRLEHYNEITRAAASKSSHFHPSDGKE